MVFIIVPFPVSGASLACLSTSIAGCLTSGREGEGQDDTDARWKEGWPAKEGPIKR